MLKEIISNIEDIQTYADRMLGCTDDFIDGCTHEESMEIIEEDSPLLFVHISLVSLLDKIKGKKQVVDLKTAMNSGRKFVMCNNGIENKRVFEVSREHLYFHDTNELVPLNTILIGSSFKLL